MAFVGHVGAPQPRFCPADVSGARVSGTAGLIQAGVRLPASIRSRRASPDARNRRVDPEALTAGSPARAVVLTPPSARQRPETSAESACRLGSPASGAPLAARRRVGTRMSAPCRTAVRPGHQLRAVSCARRAEAPRRPCPRMAAVAAPGRGVGTPFTSDEEHLVVSRGVGYGDSAGRMGGGGGEAGRRKSDLPDHGSLTTTAGADSGRAGDFAGSGEHARIRGMAGRLPRRARAARSPPAWVACLSRVSRAGSRVAAPSIEREPSVVLC